MNDQNITPPTRPRGGGKKISRQTVKDASRAAPPLFVATSAPPPPQGDALETVVSTVIPPPSVALTWSANSGNSRSLFQFLSTTSTPPVQPVPASTGPTLLGIPLEVISASAPPGGEEPPPPPISLNSPSSSITEILREALLSKLESQKDMAADAVALPVDQHTEAKGDSATVPPELPGGRRMPRSSRRKNNERREKRVATNNPPPAIFDGGKMETSEVPPLRESSTLERNEEVKEAEEMRRNPEYVELWQWREDLRMKQSEAHAEFLERYSQQPYSRKIDRDGNRQTGLGEMVDSAAILRLIEAHDVVFVVSNTGTGKSTLVPKLIFEKYHQAKIAITQTRRTAAMTSASYVSMMLRQELGDGVGYKIRGGMVGDQHTRLWYMTSYTFLLDLLFNPLDPSYTHIILDDFHERQPDIEVTTALLRLALRSHPDSFKLIIMSATMDLEKTTAYFEGFRMATYKQADLQFPHHDILIDTSCALLGIPYQPPTGFTLHWVSPEVLNYHFFIAQHLICYLNGVADYRDSILVFLPGRGNVEIMLQTLEKMIGNTADLIPWYAGVDLSAIEEAIRRPSRRNKQKIFIATDIAEVAITLPDLVFVVDLVCVKRPFMNPNDPASVLYPSLQQNWCSKENISQRRGRVGRLQQGFYFPMLPREAIIHLHERFPPPIEHSRIDELSLQLLQLVPNPVTLFRLCCDQPSSASIQTSMNTLKDSGSIALCSSLHEADENSPMPFQHNNTAISKLITEASKQLISESDPPLRYKQTVIGAILHALPLGPQHGMLVIYGLLTGMESLMILLAAVTSSLPPFVLYPNEQLFPQELKTGKHMGRKFMPRRQKRRDDALASLRTEEVMRTFSQQVRSDLIAALEAVLQFKVLLAEVDGDVQSRGLFDWCRKHYLSYERVVNIIELERHIKYELAQYFPFRDVSEPLMLQKQFKHIKEILPMFCNTTFAPQALEVTVFNNVSARHALDEGAVGIFSGLRAVPDLFTQSCFRWEPNEIIVPIMMTLHHNRLQAGFASAIQPSKRFWLSLLLLTYAVHFNRFGDDAGEFFLFSVEFCETKRFMEVEVEMGERILKFRSHLQETGQALHRLLWVHHFSSGNSTWKTPLLRLPKHSDDIAELSSIEKLSSSTLGESLSEFSNLQKETLLQLIGFYTQDADTIEVEEVEHDETDHLDDVSILTFAI